MSLPPTPETLNFMKTSLTEGELSTCKVVEVPKLLSGLVLRTYESAVELNVSVLGPEPGACTVRVYAAVLTRPPVAVPIIVNADVPGVAFRLAVKVTVDVHAGLQSVGAKPAVTPCGSPDALNVTLSVVPETSVAVSVVKMLPPIRTVPDVGLRERL